MANDSNTDPDKTSRLANQYGGESGNNVGSIQLDATDVNGLGVNTYSGNKTTSDDGRHDHALSYDVSGSSGDASPVSSANTGLTTRGGGRVTKNPNGVGSLMDDDGVHDHSVNINHSHSISTTDKETRPANTYVYYIIKAK